MSNENSGNKTWRRFLPQNESQMIRDLIHSWASAGSGLRALRRVHHDRIR